MVLYIMKYDVHAEKRENVTKWAMESAVPRILKAPGLKEFCSYRPATGTHQIAAVSTFKDMVSCASWLEQPDTQKMMEELRQFCFNLSVDIWGPSPVIPEPMRPKK